MVELLAQRGLTVSAAESCTGGLIAKRLTDVPGASAVLNMSFVTYSNEAKHRLLGVPMEILDRYGAVSEQVARAMAEGVRRFSGSSVGVGVTGISGPDGGTQEKPVGLVYMAVQCCGRAPRVEKRVFPGDRTQVRTQAAQHALRMLQEELKEV